jgi:hypothetical protein
MKPKVVTALIYVCVHPDMRSFAACVFDMRNSRFKGACFVVCLVARGVVCGQQGRRKCDGFIHIRLGVNSMQIGGRVSAVGIVNRLRAGRLGSRGSTPVRAKIFIFQTHRLALGLFQPVTRWPWVCSSLLLGGYRRAFLENAGAEARRCHFHVLSRLRISGAILSPYSCACLTCTGTALVCH